MIKKIAVTLILIFFIFGCKSNNSIKTDKKNKNKTKKLSSDTKEALKLFDKIKKRTKRDLQRHGIKKLLLLKKSKWISGTRGAIYFKQNGKIIRAHKGKKGLFGFWKIKNNKLYIKPMYKNYNRFYITKVKAIKPSSYVLGYPDRNKYLRKIKYAILVKTKKKLKNSNAYIIYMTLNKYY